MGSQRHFNPCDENVSTKSSNWSPWSLWERKRVDDETGQIEIETSKTCTASTSPTCKSWSEWSQHSAKEEICLKRNCTAYPTETKDCCTLPQWKEWSPWTACGSCGGERTRFRTCNPGTCKTPTTCNGKKEEMQSEPCEEAYEAILITYLNKAMMFTPNNLSWVHLPPIPGEPRERFTLTENIICGGSWPKTSRNCLELADTCKWRKYSSELVKRRVDSVAWKIQAGVVVIGGYFSPNTTELATTTASKLDFPVDDIIEACAINVGKYVIITGGLHHMNRVIAYDEAGKKDTLPSLGGLGRRLHACSSYKDNHGATVLLVTGGYTGNGNTKTTEILLPKDKYWKILKQPLPFCSVVGLSATNVDNIIYLIGGETDIYTYHSTSREWKKFSPMIQKEDCKIEISTLNCKFAQSLANSCGVHEDQHWIKVFSHDTSGGLFKSYKDALWKNPKDPKAKLFSRLNMLDKYKTNGKYHMKIVYPELHGSNEWIQTSSPVRDNVIEGYYSHSQNLDFTVDGNDKHWHGLGKCTGQPTKAAICDTPTTGNWFMCVGCMAYWPKPPTIPGPRSNPYVSGQHAVTKVELYIRYEKE